MACSFGLFLNADQLCASDWLLYMHTCERLQVLNVQVHITLADSVC